MSPLNLQKRHEIINMPSNINWNLKEQGCEERLKLCKDFPRHLRGNLLDFRVCSAAVRLQQLVNLKRCETKDNSPSDFSLAPLFWTAAMFWTHDLLDRKK